MGLDFECLRGLGILGDNVLSGKVLLSRMDIL